MSFPERLLDRKFQQFPIVDEELLQAIWLYFRLSVVPAVHTITVSIWLSPLNNLMATYAKMFIKQWERRDEAQVV